MSEKLEQFEISSSKEKLNKNIKTTDINILLNRVTKEKKNALKKKILTALFFLILQSLVGFYLTT